MTIDNLKSAPPAVTVLMPVHNAEAFVAAAVESILEQSFRDFEFLVIDDGCSDRSVKIIQGFEDSRIRLVHNEQQIGLIRTLNRGLELARGRYVVRMDADDISLPGRLERQVGFMEANREIGACGTWVETMGERDDGIWRYPESAEGIRCSLLFGSALAHPSVCMRREAFSHHALQYDEDYPHAEGRQLWKMASEKFPLANIGEVLLRYRLHSKSVSQQYFAQQQETVERIDQESLSRLGLIPNEGERFIHCWVATGQRNGEALPLQAVEAWLKKLSSANAEHAVYPRDEFERLLAGLWLASAYRAVDCGYLEPLRVLRSSLARSIDWVRKFGWLKHAVKRSIGLGPRSIESLHG